MIAQRPVGWRDHALGLALCAAYVAVLVATAGDLAMARDEAFYVDAAEPSTVTDVRRSFLTQIQLDFTENRRNDAENVRSSFPVGSKSLEQEPGLHFFGAAMIYRAWPRL